MDMTSYWISCAGLLGSCVAYWIGLIVGNREGRADLEHEIRLYGGAVKHVDICSRCAHITDLGLSSIPYAVTHEEARRLVSELLEVTTKPMLEREPSFHGIKLTDDGWDKLEANIRASKRKKQTKKPKKAKPKQDPVVAPKRKK